MLGSSEIENENWRLVSECLLPAESVSAFPLESAQPSGAEQCPGRLGWGQDSP